MRWRVAAGAVLWAIGLGRAEAQSVGTFRWQFQPFCNRVELAVTQVGSQYRVEGFDDQCGAGQRAPVTGLIAPNPDGTLGFGLTIVTVPGGVPVHVDARITLASLGGPWRDSAGNSGAFAFNAATGGSPRPAPTTSGSGDITGVTAGTGLTGGGPNGEVSLAVDPAVVQRRVTTACPAGQALRSIAESGTAVCEPISGSAGGDITAVNPGTGLTGGGTEGDVTLGVTFGVDGVANLAARADHQHRRGSSSNIALGIAALSSVSTGNNNIAVGGDSMVGVTTGTSNTVVGDDAGGGITTGSRNTAIGANAGFAANSQNATAIGANARADASNALVLGSISGVGGATANVNVGIGTTAPQGRLEIANDDILASELVVRTAGSSTPRLVFKKSTGTLATPTPPFAGTALLRLIGQGYTGTAFSGGGHISVETTESWSASANGSMIRMGTAANGTAFTESRVVIQHDGRVGIGTTNPNDLLDVDGDVRVGTSGTNGCVKNNSGGAIVGTCSSDLRFKRDITAFPAGLDRVTALRPVHYFWRAEEFPDKAFGSGQAYGLIAQDVEALLPELVSTDADGFKAVDYAKLPLLAIQALKELKDRHDRLQRAHDALRAAVDSRIAALETAFRTVREQ